MSTKPQSLRFTFYNMASFSSFHLNEGPFWFEVQDPAFSPLFGAKNNSCEETAVPPATQEQVEQHNL